MGETSSATNGLEQLLSLEQKIHQTLDTLKATRKEKEELARENARLRSALEGQSKSIQTLEDRLSHLEKEREMVRGRIQRLLSQVDSLTADNSEA